jgi:citrate lyase beta subunit
MRMLDASSADDRIPLRFAAAAEAGAGEALLLDRAGADAPGRAVARFRPALVHGLGCGCCRGRDPAATALASLFQARARGDVPWFSAVVADVRNPHAVARALRADLLVGARFRVPDPASAP